MLNSIRNIKYEENKNQFNLSGKKLAYNIQDQTNSKNFKSKWNDLNGFDIVSIIQKSSNNMKNETINLTNSTIKSALKHYYQQYFSTRSPALLSSNHKLSLVHLTSKTSTASSLTQKISTSNFYHTATTSSFYQSFHDLNSYSYRKNEFYSIFISILTAAVFLIFIMWRWFKMKSDLRKALREQNEINDHEHQNLETETDMTQDINPTEFSGFIIINTIIPQIRFIILKITRKFQ